MKIIIIGLTGLAGSGKSTVARRLKEEWSAHRQPFVRLMKDMLVTLLEAQGAGLATALRMVDGDLKEVPSDYLGGQTPRRAMQTLGTEWGRGLAPDFWIRAWRHAIDRRRLWALSEGLDRIVIVADDVRFANEVAAIRDMGGIIVRVDRPGAGLGGGAGAHASEAQDLGEPDLIIDNVGDVDALHAVVDRLATGFTG